MSIQQPLEEKEDIENEETPKRVGPKAVNLPAEPRILREARELAEDKDVRISILADLLAGDPVLTLELLRFANVGTGERQAIASAPRAVIRLGSEAVIELLDELADRSELMEPSVFSAFESLRQSAVRVSAIASAMAQILSRELSESAQTAGLLSYTGHMIACIYMGEQYAELAQSQKRSTLAYRVQQLRGFDLNEVMLDYLRQRSVPESLMYAFDWELKCKTPLQSALRFIIASAVEIVEAYENDRLDRYAPGKTLPSTSSLRLLKASDQQYRRMFEAFDEYFNPKEPEDAEKEETQERKAQEAVEENTSTIPELKEAEFPVAPLDAVATPASEAEATVQDQSDIEPMSPLDELLTTGQVSIPEKPKEMESYYSDRSYTLNRSGFDRSKNKPRPTLVLGKRGFQGYDADAQPTNFIEPEPEEIAAEAEKLSEEAQKVLGLISSLCEQSRDSQDLLLRLMNMLISEATFDRAALITLKGHRQTADIHTAIGEGFIDGAEITVRDPLSPLSLCLNQIKSFNVKNFTDDIAPFGVSSYAISPIRVSHSEPVVLYADCGEDRPLAFEARKMFRLVVGLLNRTLPGMEGGLPAKSLIS